MTRDEAVPLMALLVEAQKNLAAAEDFVSRSVSDKAERESLRKTLAAVIGSIAGAAVAPIVQLYPDLDPYAGVNVDEIWPRS